MAVGGRHPRAHGVHHCLQCCQALNDGQLHLVRCFRPQLTPKRPKELAGIPAHLTVA